jgi:hypothetical protein
MNRRLGNSKLRVGLIIARSFDLECIPVAKIFLDLESSRILKILF